MWALSQDLTAVARCVRTLLHAHTLSVGSPLFTDLSPAASRAPQEAGEKASKKSSKKSSTELDEKLWSAAQITPIASWADCDDEDDDAPPAATAGTHAAVRCSCTCCALLPR